MYSPFPHSSTSLFNLLLSLHPSLSLSLSLSLTLFLSSSWLTWDAGTWFWLVGFPLKTALCDFMYDPLCILQIKTARNVYLQWCIEYKLLTWMKLYSCKFSPNPSSHFSLPLPYPYLLSLFFCFFSLPLSLSLFLSSVCLLVCLSISLAVCISFSFSLSTPYPFYPSLSLLFPPPVLTFVLTWSYFWTTR